MRLLPGFFVLLAGLTSCTLLRSECVIVRGSVWLVPQKDVRSAIAVVRAGTNRPTELIDSVVVSSHSELYVYFSRDSLVIDGNDEPLCAVARKESGQWHYTGMAWAWSHVS